MTPVIVAKESGMDESYLIWMVFASLIVVGISTLLQVHRIGPVGGGAVPAHVHRRLLHTPFASPP